MDDSDNLCPLCCEELDISDREFYPCKCGYQVCMWCWHRIRESESGLCPACRTPYGEDPHQFSAVDVEEVLKANKEKEAAAKRERKQETSDNNNNDGGIAAMEIPKDRSQLANMRVIRRNLVYAVGLPPTIANEDVLRRADYFGQYGKISKIVLNRTQVTGDSRRASASAYVTFVHKEDTLACILALDGFFLENRNIRASYGTSKYCSAFIKNVRCNNPDCTYLHEMGAIEDTFTKQEIQAGYVTSGRDVLARQQQIVAEQLRQGATGGIPRKKIGGGGPSGTGRAATSPVFPVPEYDEPVRQAPHLVPAPAGVSRAVTASAAAVSLNPSNIAAKLGRSSSVGARNGIVVPPPAPPTRKPHTVGTTAASVVAGVHTNNVAKVEVPDAHLSLAALTPLSKRPSKPVPKTATVGSAPEEKIPNMRNGSKKNGASRSSGQQRSSSSIGGDVIGQPLNNIGTQSTLAGLGGDPVVPTHTMPGSQSSLDTSGGVGSSSELGGEVFTGQLSSRSTSAIGSGIDKRVPQPFGNTDPVVGGTGRHGVAPGSAIGGSVIGSHSSSGNSSSALASLLGISLPTGSGSLQESTSLWTAPHASGPSALSALNGSPMLGQENGFSNSVGPSRSAIGGVTISSNFGGNAPHGPSLGGGGNKNDIALLQSLLPGVQITSGNPTGSDDRWGLAPGPQNSNGNVRSPGGDRIGGWGGSIAPGGGAPVRAIGQNNGQQNQNRGPGIW